MEGAWRHGPRDAEASVTAALTADIEAAVARLCQCWNRVALADIEALWDADEELPYCLPQELEAPLIGWDGLRMYWHKAAARLNAAQMRTWNFNVKLAAPGLAVALYEMHWNGAIRGFHRPVGIYARVTALFRAKANGWHICHYVEAPLSFTLQLQLRNAAQADADFLARIGWQGDVAAPRWPDGTPL